MIGYLPAIGLGTLALFYLLWAAMHDIARAEADVTVEYAVLVACVPAALALYRAAMRYLTARERAACGDNSPAI